MQKKVEEKRKEMDKKTDTIPPTLPVGGAEQKASVSCCESRQSSAAVTPRNVRYSATYATMTHVGHNKPHTATYAVWCLIVSHLKCRSCHEFKEKQSLVYQIVD